MLSYTSVIPKCRMLIWEDGQGCWANPGYKQGLPTPTQRWLNFILIFLEHIVFVDRCFLSNFLEKNYQWTSLHKRPWNCQNFHPRQANTFRFSQQSRKASKTFKFTYNPHKSNFLKASSHLFCYFVFTFKY